MLKKWKRWKRICAMTLSLLLVLQLLPGLQQASAAESADPPKRFVFVEPSAFQPAAGETTRITWNWEIDHLTMIKLMSGDELVAIIQGETFYAGGYVPHEFIWDGKDTDGNFVPTGTYELLIEPQDKYRPYGSKIPVTILGESKDIAISPNRTGDRFLVYGTAGTAQGVTDVQLTLTAGGQSQQVTAQVEANRWSAYVRLAPYTETLIEADVRGTNPNKPSLTVTNHPFRFFDELQRLALAYYGDDRKGSEIAQDNELPATTDEHKLVGQNILILNQAYPFLVPDQDPVLGGNLGIVDLFSGTNTNTPAHMGMGNNVGISPDIVIGGSFPLFFTRTYNSRDEYLTELGPGFSHTFSERLRDLGKAVLVRLEDGHIERYDRTASGMYVAGEGIYNTLEKLGDGSFVLTNPDQNKLYFSKEGRPVRFTTSKGVEMRISYDGGRLGRVEQEGSSLAFTYSEDGWLEKITDQAGRERRCSQHNVHLQYS